MEKKSQLVDKGIRGQSVGRCGVSHGVLRSAIQKYIRRAEEEKAIRCAVEFDRFSELGAAGEPIRTNLINRIAIIVMEDIGAANPGLLYWVETCRAEWKKHRTTERGRVYLLSAVREMARSAKSRLTSHARTAYSGSPEARDAASSVELKTPIGLPTEDLPRAWEATESGTVIHTYQGNLEACLSKRSDEAIWWADKLANVSLKVARDRSKKGIQAVWQSILAEAPGGPAFAHIWKGVTTLHKWHKELSAAREDFCFAVCAILILNRRDSLPAFTTPAMMTHEEIETLYAECPCPLQIDEYCVDKHTLEGRKLGMGTKEFVTEGAKVENEAPWARDDRYLQVYMDVRIGIPESTLFTAPVRCQLVTSETKTDTYLAQTAPDGEVVFVKGPLERSNAKAQVAIDTLKRFMTGMSIVGYRAIRAVPDLFPDTPLGRRRKCSGIEYFLVAPDLFHPNGYEVLSTVMKSSKVWPETAIYSFETDPAAAGTHADLLQPSVPLVVALCFRYVMGIGDTCGRNLLQVGDAVYSLDEEKFLGKYAPPRYGEEKKNAVLAKINEFWPSVVEVIAQWPDELGALPGGQIQKVITFMSPRVNVLVEGGPGPLYGA